MRRLCAGHALALGCLIFAAAALGGSAGPTRKPTTEPKKPLKSEEAIGDIAEISSASEVRIEGVGLVVHLDNTGSDPEPSYYREKLLDEMRKAGVESADKLLASKTTSLVLVSGRIPAGVTKQDRLDVELELTPSSTTTSLAGGWLVATRLTEMLVVKGQAHTGSPLATAGGPVMIGSESKPDDPKVGRVLGGCRVKKDMPYALMIDKNHRSIRTATLLQSVINQRFHQHEGTDQSGMANAKSDEYLTIKVPNVYHHNQYRYFRVVKLLPVVNNPALQTQRIEQWGREVLDPKTAGMAALRLEGIGPKAIDALKKGLTSDNAQVRFLAAEALAYLDDASGVDTLAKSAVDMPEFRAFALAALAAMDQAAATLRLRKLMDEPDVQVRYGAFNALHTQDEHDASLGQVKVIEDPPVEDPDNGNMAMAIRTAPKRKVRQDDPFSLYLVDSEGPPLVHVSRSRRCEIVIFGKDQRLLTPVVLGGSGPILINASDGDPSVQISRIMPSKFDRADLKVDSSLELGEVIRETARLGATYPEIVGILQAAAKQKNLPGPLVVDAVPVVNPAVDAAILMGVDASAKKDPAVTKTKLETPAKPKRLRDRLFRFRSKEQPAEPAKEEVGKSASNKPPAAVK